MPVKDLPGERLSRRMLEHIDVLPQDRVGGGIDAAGPEALSRQYGHGA